MVPVSGIISDIMMAAPMTAPMAPVVPTSIPPSVGFPQVVPEAVAQNVPPAIPFGSVPQVMGGGVGGGTEGVGNFVAPPVQQMSIDSDPINLVLRVR